MRAIIYKDGDHVILNARRESCEGRIYYMDHLPRYGV
jgi:hypothetical protein